MSSKVVSLTGAIPACGQPDDEVVEKLRGLLAKAESGGISGIAFAMVISGENLVADWAGNADQHRMMAGVSLLQYRLIKAVDDNT